MLPPLNYNFTSPSYKVYKIPVQCDDFYATSKFILININNTLKIYSHTQCKNIRLYKIIKHNLILFINKKCIMNILYRILLNEKGTSIQKNIEEIILYLKVDEILKVEEECNGFLVTYKNNTTKYFNCNLEIESKESFEFIMPLKVDTLIKTSNRSIYIKKDEVNIDEKIIEMKKIIKVVGDKEYLFVQNKEAIKAIIFK